MVIINIIINGIIKRVFWPLCRLYARLLGDNPADIIYKKLCSLVFYQIHHYWPDFNIPKTFSEKIFCRMLFDRRSILTTLSDKFLVRNYVRKKIGEEYLIPLLWTGINPEEIPFASLPDKFVIKTNHDSGTIFIAKNKYMINQLELKRMLNYRLRNNFCLNSDIGIEWAYKNIPPRILIEQYIEEDGKPPVDYKFYCFSGSAKYLLIIYDRFGYHREKHFTIDFLPLDFWNGIDQYHGPFNIPINYDEMIKIAEKLSADFDFVRVDLYNIKGKIYFGELSFYPAGGLAPFVPRDWDYIFGEKWKYKRDIKCRE